MGEKIAKTVKKSEWPTTHVIFWKLLKHTNTRVNTIHFESRRYSFSSSDKAPSIEHTSCLHCVLCITMPCLALPCPTVLHRFIVPLLFISVFISSHPKFASVSIFFSSHSDSHSLCWGRCIFHFAQMWLACEKLWNAMMTCILCGYFVW